MWAEKPAALQAQRQPSPTDLSCGRGLGSPGPEPHRWLESRGRRPGVTIAFPKHHSDRSRAPAVPPWSFLYFEHLHGMRTTPWAFLAPFLPLPRTPAVPLEGSVAGVQRIVRELAPRSSWQRTRAVESGRPSAQAPKLRPDRVLMSPV